MNFLTLFGTAILAVAVLLFLKQLKSNAAIPLALIFGLLLTKQAVNLIQGELAFFKELFDSSFSQKSTSTLFKIFGISLSVEAVSDICRDAGENLIASRIEFLGKLEILTLCIPLIQEILKIIKQIML